MCLLLLETGVLKTVDRLRINWRGDGIMDIVGMMVISKTP